MSLEEIEQSTITTETQFDDLEFSKGPTEEEMAEIEEEFSDVLSESETSENDSRFSKQEMSRIDDIWTYIERQRAKSRQDKEMEELEKLTSQEYQVNEQTEDMEDDENMGVEEVSLDELENFDDVEDFYQ